MLRKNLNRQLLIRLIIGGLAMAIVMGGSVLWIDLERVDERIVALGIEEARLLSPKLATRLDKLNDVQRQILDAEMDSVLESRAQAGNIHFAVAEIYDLNRVSVAESAAHDADEIESRIDLSRRHFPMPGDTWYEKHLINGQVYVQVVTPLWNGPDQVGWFEGVFQIPMQTLLSVGWSGLHASLLVIVAVIATTALLYPLLSSLNARLVTRSRQLLDANLGTLEALGSAIAKRDSDTNAHNFRVTLYSVRLGEAAGLKPAQIRSLMKGAFLHDVGKIAIPDRILLKPGRLDDDEMTIMRTHVTHGLDIVNRFAWLQDAADVVGGHHEKVDGSGYPAGLKGDAIPINARIFAIADVFDALTSRRPYKEPFSLERALAIMTESKGSHFDARLLDLFVIMAPSLHAHLCGREDEGVREELRKVSDLHFAHALTI